MSFVTIALAEGEMPGFETPPDPCPHSGAAMSAATRTVADHRAQYLIPTSDEGPKLLTCTQCEAHVGVAPGSGLIIAPIRRVDNHRPDVCSIEQVVEAHKRVTA